MENGGEGSVVVGAEEARRAAVLCPLVQANLNGTGSLESGINDAVCELGVSRATVWRWIKQLTVEGGRISAGALRKRGRPVGTTSISGKVEAVIEEHLRCHFLSRERSSLSRVVTEIRSTCGRSHRAKARDKRKPHGSRISQNASHLRFKGNATVG